MTSRRSFLHQSAGAVTVLGAAACAPDDPAAAQSSSSPLSALQAMNLAALGDALAPGAKAAGLVDFVQAQLSAPPGQNLLMLSYLGVPVQEHLGFYQTGLDGLESAAQRRHGKAFHALDGDATMVLIGDLFTDKVDTWKGPPSSFVLFALRADATDVVYGTRAGFERIGMPHMAHIEPVEEW